jgi:serine/threonine kinase 16
MSILFSVFRGFSLVYLVEDPVTQRLFAVKKVHCADNAIGTGGDGSQDAVRQAVQEAEMTRLFDHPNIIKVLVSSNIIIKYKLPPIYYYYS